MTKTGVLKNVHHDPINSRNKAAAYYQTLEEVPGPLLQEKIQKQEKIGLIRDIKILKNIPLHL